MVAQLHPRQGGGPGHQRADVHQPRAGQPAQEAPGLGDRQRRGQEQGLGEHDNLLVKEVVVDQGPTLKRWRPRAMGRATRINKRTSHVTIVLDDSAE